MAKKDPVADAVARLAALRTIDDPAQLADGVAALLKERSGYVVSRVAALAAERSVRAAIPAIVARLSKLLSDPRPDDPSGAAALELTRALVALSAGYEAEDVALVAVKYVKWEPVFGGSVDVAVSVRGNAAILLAAMGSTQATRAAVELLAAPDRPAPREQINWPARADAARALTMIGSDAAGAVLRYKLLLGADDTNVLADCLIGLLTIERDAAVPLATRMLTSDAESHTEAALLALGGWRDAGAFALLRQHADRFLIGGSRDLFLASIAMTRQSSAIDYLFELAGSDSSQLRAAAIEALEPLRPLPNVADRIDAITGRRTRK